MSTWVNVFINENQIQFMTEKAALVKQPKSDWLIWVSKKCIRTGSHSANRSVGFMTNGSYRIFRQGGVGGREVLDEMNITGSEACERFGVQG